MRSNKRAISAVVATVLIILITVAAVAIVWMVVIPLIWGNIQGTPIIDFRIDEGYTFYDIDDDVIAVAVDRRAVGSEEEVTRVYFYVSDRGNTYSYVSSEDVVDVNEQKIYYLNVDENVLGVALDEESVGLGVALGVQRGRKVVLTDRFDVQGFLRKGDLAVIPGSVIDPGLNGY